MQKAPHHSADLMHLPWQRFTRNTTYQEASGCFVYPKRPRTTHDDPCRQTALGLRCSSPPALVPSKQLACTKKGLRHLKHQPGQQAQIRTFLHHVFNGKWYSCKIWELLAAAYFRGVLLLTLTSIFVTSCREVVWGGTLQNRVILCHSPISHAVSIPCSREVSDPIRVQGHVLSRTCRTCLVLIQVTGPDANGFASSEATSCT